MHFLTRPSKSFLFDYLEELLSREHGEVGIDAASDRLRNRHMFKTRFYYGLDKNREALIRGLKSHHEENTFGIEADLTHLEKLPEGSVDVVLSSNTLYQIPLEIRGSAVRGLARLTAPGGLCVLEFTKDRDFYLMLSILKEEFSNISIVYFKNPVSRLYEYFAYNRESRPRRLFGTSFFRLISWCLSRLEYLTKGIPSLNRHALVIARGTSKNHEHYSFDMTHVTRIGERLYSL